MDALDKAVAIPPVATTVAVFHGEEALVLQHYPAQRSMDIQPQSQTAVGGTTAMVGRLASTGG